MTGTVGGAAQSAVIIGHGEGLGRQAEGWRPHQGPRSWMCTAHWALHAVSPSLCRGSRPPRGQCIFSVCCRISTVAVAPPSILSPMH